MVMIGFLLLISAIGMIVRALVMLFPMSTARERLKRARRLILGGFALVIIGTLCFSPAPGTQALVSGRQAQDQVQPTEPAQSDPASDLKIAATGFYRTFLHRSDACSDAVAGAFLSGENLEGPGSDIEKYSSDTHDAVDACKNSGTLLGAIVIPDEFPVAARQIAARMVASCQHAAYQAQYANGVVANALDSGGPIPNLKDYVQLQKNAGQVMSACDRESDALDRQTGADWYATRASN